MEGREKEGGGSGGGGAVGLIAEEGRRGGDGWQYSFIFTEFI